MIYNFEQLSFQILTIDRFFHQKGFFNVKARPYAALSFRVNGTGNFKIKNKNFVVTPGDILFIPANTPYEVEYSISESIVANLNECNYSEAEIIRLKNPSEAELLFLQLLKEWNVRYSFNQAKSAIYDILEKINNDKRTSSVKTLFTTAVQYIETHYCETTLDIGTVCEECFISTSSLHRAFLHNLGISPKQYIIKLRMNKAVQLLSEKNYSVKEISYLCGFSDEKYFSRAFKNKYGYPPSQLRNFIVF